MPSLHALVRSLRRDVVRLRRIVARLSDKPKRAERAPVDRRLLSCRECDRMYRRRKGTAAAAYRARLLPGRYNGRTLLVSAKHAAELFDAEYRR